MRSSNAAALASLRPGAEWSMSADDPATLLWLDQVQPRPTAEEIAAERARLEARYEVATIDIVRRLSAAGLLAAADAALNADIELKARFYTVGFVYSDNDEARAFLAAIGADPDAILGLSRS